MQEYIEKKIEEHDKRISEMEKNFVEHGVLVKQFTEVAKEHSQTMKRVEETMIRMSFNLETNSDSIKILTSKVDKLGEKVEGEIDKNKVDLLSPIRDDAKAKLSGKAYVGIGAAGAVALFEAIRVVFENWPKK